MAFDSTVNYALKTLKKKLVLSVHYKSRITAFAKIL